MSLIWIHLESNMDLSYLAYEMSIFIVSIIVFIICIALIGAINNTVPQALLSYIIDFSRLSEGIIPVCIQEVI